MRFHNTPELFGDGAGSGTTREVICALCGAKYPDTGETGDSTIYTEFAGVEIADCCFEEIEREIWDRRFALLPWIRKVLEHRRDLGQENLDSLDEIAKLRSHKRVER